MAQANHWWYFVGNRLRLWFPQAGYRGAQPSGVRSVGETPARSGRRQLLKTAWHEAPYAGILVAIVAGALWLYVLPPGFRFDRPIVYGQGDSLWDAHIVKLILETGWYPRHSENLGAPFGAADYDWTETQSLHYAVLKLIGLFSSDWVVVTNISTLSAFFLAALSAYGVLRWIRLEPQWSMLGGTIFAFMPYHFFRLVPLSHPTLAEYWCVPIAIWLALRQWEPPSARQRAPLRALGWASAIVASAAIELYYAFFTCCLISLAGAANAIERRSWRAAMPAAATVLAVVFVVVVQLTPTALYWSQNGPSPGAVVRYPSESEVYGLKPIQLLVPQPSHRLPWARDLAAYYNGTSPIVNENRSAALGVVASVGFLVLVGAAVRRLILPSGGVSILDKLAFLALSALALATVGGVGTALAWMLIPQIRGYNRLSIYIAFFSIAALLLAVEALFRRISLAHKRFRVIAGLAAVATGLFALWDQTTPFDQRRLQESFENDRDFVHRVEAAVPAGTAVYQLPYHLFPEGARVNEMADYDLLRGYLHSRELRWSYGGMRGRPGDRWLYALSTKPLEEQLAAAAAAGFGAVYVDRRAYTDRGLAIESTLRARLGSPLAMDRAGDLSVYRLLPSSSASATQVPTRGVS